MSATPEWQTLMSTWQSQPVDLPKLTRATRWKTRRMMLMTAYELLSVVVIWAMTPIYWERSGQWPMIRYWMLFWCVATPVAVWITIRMRRGMWSAADESLLGLLRLQRNRALGGVRMGRYTIASCGVLGVFTFIWLAVGLILYPPPGGDSWYRLASPFAFTAGWLLLFVLISLIYIRRRQEEVTKVDSLLRDLESSS